LSKTQDTATAFEASIFGALRIALRITLNDPRFAVRGLRLLWRQWRATRVRARHEKAGTHVPPFLIYSATGECNLDCAGCYDKLLHRFDRAELSAAQMRRVLAEARELGVSIMLLAGGEPLLRRELLDITVEFPEILFLLFTNGSLLDDERILKLKRQRHVIPVLSIEGDESRTDDRRGDGTYRYVVEAMERLRRRRVFFGTSTTLTSENFELHLDANHLRSLIRRGCRLFYSINYIPVEPGTEHLQLKPEQVDDLERRLAAFREALPAIFIAFPHDEVALGGCLAAGRGFLHINAYGDVEPCPFSPYSDTNLVDVSFKEALASPLLQSILTSGVVLDETDGQCALWKNRTWVESLLSNDEPGAGRQGLSEVGEEPEEARSASSHRVLADDKIAQAAGASWGTQHKGTSTSQDG
jgi:MoaA/NifB/PqqE/SkfB family radical SAM enzyme